MQRKILVFTGTRAEYGLLKGLMKAIQACPSLTLQVLVSGAHLSVTWGETGKEIARDGFVVDASIDMELHRDEAVDVVQAIGTGLRKIAPALDRLRPDFLVLLGDRYEALMVAQAALILRIPVVHLHGGEITEGAYDDAIRHAITKMAYLHFVSAEPYRQRVIQMGEAPDRVFNVGALGLDVNRDVAPLSRADLSEVLGLDVNQCPYLLVTYHPATAADEDPQTSFTALLEALDQFPEYAVVLTYPNADNGSLGMMRLLEDYAGLQPRRVSVRRSLGTNYIPTLRHAAALVGNSSSGIIEAPAYCVPTVNIGARQKGRLAAKSVLHCAPTRADITQTLTQALQADFIESCRHVTNPYGQGQAVRDIVRTLETWAPWPRMKVFYDLKLPEGL